MHNLSITSSSNKNTSYHSTFTTTSNTSHHHNLSEPETSEIEDGPSFKDALKAFQSKSTSNSANQSPSTPRAVTGLRLSPQHQLAAQQILQSSTQRIERTVQQTTTNRSYHMQDR